jgi:hypothetical protein
MLISDDESHNDDDDDDDGDEVEVKLTQGWGYRFVLYSSIHFISGF